MDRSQLQKAIISILIGAGIMALNQIFGVILDFLKSHTATIIPPVVGMYHFLSTWRIDQTA